MKKIILISVLLLIIQSSKGFSMLFNYHNYFVGERPAMMGGAFTALADDISGAFYNPAGLADMKQSSIALNANLYSYQYFERNEISNSTVIKAQNMITIPTLIGVNMPLGEATLTFTMIEPNDIISYSFDNYQNGESTKSEAQSHVYLFGPSLGYKLTDNLSVGISTFFQYYNSKFSVTSNKTTGCNNFQNYMNSFAFLPVVGIKLKLSKEIKIGSAFYFQSINITSKNDYSYYNSSGPTLINGTNNTYYQSPNRFVIGIAYDKEKDFTLSADFTYYFSQSFSAPNSTLHVQDNSYRHEEIQHIDISLGSEIFISENHSIRFGLFTNTSGASDANKTMRMNLYGASLGIGFWNGGFSSGVGISIQYGTSPKQSNTESPSNYVENKYFSMMLTLGTSIKF